MPENLNEQFRYKDILSDQHESGNLEIARSAELETAAGKLGGIKDALDHNSPIPADLVLQAKAALDAVQVDIEGEKYSLKDLAEVPDLKKDLELLKKINAGDNIIVNGQQLSFISPRIARMMMDEASTSTTNTFIFDNLKKMSPETARIFSGLEGNLWFYDEVKLSPEATAELVQGKLTAIKLNRVKKIPAEVLEELAKFTGNLELEGLEELSPEEARAISKRTGDLGLPGIKKISVEALTELANYNGLFLQLSGLEALNLDMAKAMTKYKGILELSGLRTVPDEVVEELCRHQNVGFFIPYPRDITPEQAKVLAQYSGILGLGKVPSISLEVAEILNQHQMRKEVADIAAKEGEKGLIFHGLQTMSREAFDLLKDKSAFYERSNVITAYFAEDEAKNQS